MAFYIRKSSGEKELFDMYKFRTSLIKAGADDHIINRLVRELEQFPKLRSTKEIYGYALNNNFRFLSYGDGCLISNETAK